MPSLRFPPKFVWGVATAASQVEGAASTDGKGPSIWDTFSRIPGAVHNGDTPENACDHFHRFDEDFTLMRELGVKHYRLSIAWPRILPDGRGAANPSGIDFYHRLFDSLERHGITPWVTLFHWDLPQTLEDAGGWRVRSLVDAFAAYADLVVRTYSSRVKHWFTLSEIFSFTELGYGLGRKAPGAKEDEAVVNQACHHALLCHGHGVRAVREHGGSGAVVGLVDNPVVAVPLSLQAREVAAAREAFAGANLRVLDPIFRGRYDEGYLQRAGRAAPRVAEGDFDLIAQPGDFIGLNIYTGYFVRVDANGRPENLAFTAHAPRSDSSWPSLLPQALYWGPRFFTEIYGKLPIYITENGLGYEEPETTSHELPDLRRRECLRSYLNELHAAIREGVPIKGYFLRTLLDNFAWEDGYSCRYGIIHNDFRTQKRTPKLSARWYAGVIRRNRLV